MANFLQRVEGDIIAVGEAAWSQLKSELLTLEQAAVSEIKSDIVAVVGKLEAGSTIEQLETELLNLWSAEKPQILQQVVAALSSGAIQVLIAMAKAAVAL